MSKIYNKELIPFHPCYYINEIIEEMEITQKEFASCLGMTSEMVNNLLNGEIRISNDFALKLAEVLNTTPEIWLNLQKSYDEKIIKLYE